MVQSSKLRVFVPFLGDFLSIRWKAWLISFRSCFRPLSWGLSFNSPWKISTTLWTTFSSPFLGTFFQYEVINIIHDYGYETFSSPFLGTFFQCTQKWLTRKWLRFSSPFLGTFFQWTGLKHITRKCLFSSPFLGTFFQFHVTCKVIKEMIKFSSPFLGTFFQWDTL